MTKRIISMIGMTKLPEQIFHKSRTISPLFTIPLQLAQLLYYGQFLVKILEINRQETESYMKN